MRIFRIFFACFLLLISSNLFAQVSSTKPLCIENAEILKKERE